MRIPRIYTDQPLDSGANVTLEGGAARHLCSALRMSVGEEITLFNGDGGEFSAALTALGKSQVGVVIGEHREVNRESPLKLHLAIAVSRGERMDWAIQKAVELGVNQITPLLTERCEVKLQGERADKRQAHWQQVAVSACEQCGRSVVPVIHPPVALQDWMASLTSDLKLVLHHRTEQDLDQLPHPTSLALLIGPEGGLSADEIQQAEAAGFIAARFGPRVLRTETAPVVALSMAQQRWGDF